MWVGYHWTGNYSLAKATFSSGKNGNIEHSNTIQIKCC